jgi:hypothetical protein
MYACTAYVHVRTLGYIGEKWRDIMDQEDMALNSMYYGMMIHSIYGMSGVLVATHRHDMN